MKWVLLGGAGFIGSHLQKRLVEAKHEVLIVDNLSTGSKWNILRSSNVKFVEADVSSSRAWMFHADKADVIVNLACPASPVHYQKLPLKTIMSCVDGTRNALELAYLRKARFLQASTSEIYGDPTEHPQTESYWGNVNTWGPRSCYDEGKRMAETLCYEYQKLGVDVRVARIFNTYGPRMQFDDGRVVSNFILQALKDEPLTIYGDGSQTRSFCYVSDLVEGLLTLTRTDVKTPVNLGNPTEFTVKDLAQTVLALTESTSTIEYRDLPVNDPTRRKPDITKAKELGWEPTVPLHDGLLKTIYDFCNRLAMPELLADR